MSGLVLALIFWPLYMFGACTTYVHFRGKEKLKLLRQTGTPRTLPVTHERPTAAVVRQEKPAKARRIRKADPSPDEILRRAAEVRAAREMLSTPG